MQPAPILRPLPWLVVLADDLGDGLPTRRRELAFLRVDRPIPAEIPVIPRLKEAA